MISYTAIEINNQIFFCKDSWKEFYEKYTERVSAFPVKRNYKKRQLKKFHSIKFYNFFDKEKQFTLSGYEKQIMDIDFEKIKETGCYLDLLRKEAMNNF
jgi:hypothetical protein